MAFSKITAYGERGWLGTLQGYADDRESGRAARSIAQWLRSKEGVEEAAPGIDSVYLRFDQGRLSAEEAAALLARAGKEAAHGAPSAVGAVKEIPVSYGGENGPDLTELCAALTLSEEEYIARHCERIYEVIMLGFAPGFAYLGPLPADLSAPRLATPRQRAPAGSVAVAGAFTGVYPLASPGGWRLIGRTGAALFDPSKRDPFYLNPGDRVRFTQRGADRTHSRPQSDQHDE